MKQKLTLLFFILLCLTGNVWADPTLIDESAPVFTFCMPEMAGQLSFGIIKGEESAWLTDMKIKVKKKKDTGVVQYQITTPLPGKGELLLNVARLSDSDGIIIEMEGNGLDESVQILWSYAGASGKKLSPEEAMQVQPAYCTYNVYSVEHTAFTLYYGESMNLKVIQAVMPLSSDICLADYHTRTNPLRYFRSGKKTDAPSLAGVLPLENGKKEYFCVYRQNEKADYNYYMLPELYSKNSSGK